MKTTGSQSLISSGPIFGTVELDHQGFTSKFKLEAEVDSGSHCMVITHTIFNQAFPKNVLHNLCYPILNFNGSEIDSIEGFFCTTAFFNGQHCPAFIYVIEDGCDLVIG